MPEAIHKLQPNRTMALRGFDDRGAGAALHAATGDSFKVSGVFRDAADFCVLMLYDADNFYEHPRLKYLPDFDFSGMALQFDVHYEGLQTLDSDQFPTIDWPFLDVVRPDGSTERIRLFDHATLVSGAYSQAEAQFQIVGTAAAFDRVTLWFQNFAFDYIAAGGEAAATIAQILSNQINATDFSGGVAIEAEAAGSSIRIRARRPGRDGNFITMYGHASGALSLTPGEAQFAGGSSDATWRVSLDFSALGIDQVRQMWLTFAPAIRYGAAYESTEWVATFTNWTVSGEKKWLKVAGPGSVRVEETDAWCTYSGTSWSTESGFYSKGFSRRASEVGDRVTVRYSCQGGHDLWLGTSLYTDRGIWGVSLDGDAETDLDCYLLSEPQVNTRRRIRENVPAGEHTVTLRVKGKNAASAGTACYFDFLEAVIPSDVPDPVPARALVSPAMDYGTDHTYKPPPARVMWWMDRLGFAGPLNVYVSVFWWNQRKRVGESIPHAEIDFGAVAMTVGDQVFVQIADAVFGKTILSAADVPAAVVARHFAHFINGISVGVWAEADAGVLTLTLRAVGPAYNFTVEAWRETPPSTARTAIAVQGSLQGGTAGLWVVDTGQSPALNRGAREWLMDLCAECAARSREVTFAYSMELLNPPEGENGEAWASRYPNGDPVLTATGFADNQTTHCAFNAAVLNYHKRVYLETADMMADAGLPVVLQFGEFLWWFFNNASPPTSDPGADPTKGMAYYDAETMAAAQAALGRPLHVFRWPEDDPSVNGGADADFLRTRLDSYCRAIRDHVRASHPAAEFEILLALDVNYPRQAGIHALGGRLNHYVNVPPGWLDPATAPFDRVKMEALDWQVGTRSTDLSRETMRYPYVVGQWPRAKCKLLIGLFNGGAPWARAYLDTVGEGLAAVNFWAHDHVHIFGWPVEEPVSRDTAQSV